MPGGEQTTQDMAADVRQPIPAREREVATRRKQLVTDRRADVADTGWQRGDPGHASRQRRTLIIIDK
jgi:hypothetical protein